MPAFVPVFDPEVPRSEQDPNSEALLKHRRWDTPHALVRPAKPESDSGPHPSRSYYRDRYNDNDNRDSRRDEKFYRKPVHDAFDYAPPKRKKAARPVKPDPAPGDQKPLKAVKKERPGRPRK